MKTRTFMAFTALIILSLSATAQEREKRAGFEFSGGAAIATSKIADASLNPGFGFEGIFHYRVLPHTGIYAGWGWNQLSSDNSFGGQDVSFEETGYVFGLQFKHPIQGSAIAYFVRAGGSYNHIEIENKEGTLIEDSGHGLGYQVATGLDIPLGSYWSLTPAVKFSALSRDINMNNEPQELNYDYISIRVGILKRF